MNLLEKIISGIIITGTLIFGGCESKNYSTPQSTIETFIEASKKKDLETVLTSIGYDKQVIDYIINEDKRIYNNLIEEDCIINNDMSIEIVGHRYNVYFDEEISIVKTRVKKRTGINVWYWILVSDGGKWRMIKYGNMPSFKELWENGYDDPKSTESKNSKLLEIHKNVREGFIKDYLRNRKK